ncbi:hypothetical protein PENTCL1PPCAC_17849, partial [Pristionchus entomophagus]
MVRDGVFNPLHHGGALFQQFAVDSWVKVEQNRLNFHRKNQKELRCDTYKAVQVSDSRIENFFLFSSYFSCTLFKLFRTGLLEILQMLPAARESSFHPLDQQAYQYAMAIPKYGKPDFFLTFT